MEVNKKRKGRAPVLQQLTQEWGQIDKCQQHKYYIPGEGVSVISVFSRCPSGIWTSHVTRLPRSFHRNIWRHVNSVGPIHSYPGNLGIMGRSMIWHLGTVYYSLPHFLASEDTTWARFSFLAVALSVPWLFHIWSLLTISFLYWVRSAEFSGRKEKTVRVGILVSLSNPDNLLLDLSGSPVLLW